MPYVGRRGYTKIARESAVGTVSTAQLPGLMAGPLSVMGSSTFNGANVGLGIPTITRQFDDTFAKHISPMQVGRRAEEVWMVAGRREMAGSITVPVTPDAFGMLMFLTFGADSIVSTQSNTLPIVAANATSVTLQAALTANISAGQRLWVNDGVNSEYVNVATNAASGTSVVAVTGGGGTGGGFKFAHAAATSVQFGPWTHTFTPSNAAAGIPTFQVEDNKGGHANSNYYTGCSIDQLDLAATMDNDMDVLTVTAKIIGLAGSTTPVAGSGSFTLPLEEQPCAAGNAAVWTDPPNASLPGGAYPHIYVPDIKVNVANTAKLVKAAQGSPDPYSSIVTAFKQSGTFETIFEDYGVWQDYANNVIWNPFDIKFRWASLGLVGTTGPVAPSLELKMNRFGTQKLKPSIKDDVVRVSGDFNALEGPDFGATAQVSWILVNGVAQY